MKSELGLQQLKQLFPNIDFDLFRDDEQAWLLILRIATDLTIFNDYPTVESLLKILNNQEGESPFNTKPLVDRLKILKSYIKKERNYRLQTSTMPNTYTSYRGNI